MSNIHGFSDYNPNNNRERQYVVRSESKTSDPVRGSLEFEGNSFQSPPIQNPPTSQDSFLRSFVRRLFPNFYWKSFTLFITVILVLVFIATKITQARLIDVPITETCVFYRFGANFTPAITVYHHIHRLVLPIFLHGGWLHLIFNNITQLMYGFTLEKFYGLKKFVFSICCVVSQEISSVQQLIRKIIYQLAHLLHYLAFLLYTCLICFNTKKNLDLEETW